MTVEQRDVYLYPPSHDPSLEPHPFIVLSTKGANGYENTFVACMITSSEKYRDDFSFELTDEMFESPLHKKNSHVRMHLVTLCLERQIRGIRINRIKPFYFGQLMKAMGDIVFNYDFTALN
jgi:PemK-like, MazF-like toxin of type II toxin-antitoxin system